MENINNLIIEALKKGENEHFEFKEAKNDFPKDAMETISAFANTDGGYLILGVKEVSDGEFEIQSVKNINKVKNRMFDLLHQPGYISYNPINNHNVIEHSLQIENSTANILIVKVPKVPYNFKPVYINNNDHYTYIRKGSYDYLCDRKLVESMIRDASEESYDSVSIENYTIDDLDKVTIRNFRDKFKLIKPEHPFNNMSDEQFLIKINALRKSRTTNKIEPTVAGLLVFGNHNSLKEYMPHYNVEYINKTKHNKNNSFVDRLIYDGMWGEDNLYNFFNNCIEKLYLTINESSQIDDDSITRVSTSKLKIAIREALINSIIHCDYHNELGIVITRYSDRFVFKNGGSLRISKTDFFKGGHSKPRNYYIQEIFRQINLCEKAGSGVPKIMDAVESNKYKYPELTADFDQVEFILWDTTIIDNLGITKEIEKDILKIIISDKTTTIKSIEKKLNIHRNTASKYLNELTEKGILFRAKIGRNYVYSFAINKDFDKYNVIEIMYSMIDKVKNII